MLKVGILGYGSIATVHFSSWKCAKNAEVVAVCDIRQERLDMLPDVKGYLSFDEMMANEELDIVDICLPTYMHAEYAKKAMEMGKHVICEKPISLKKSDVSLLYDTARKQGVCFMVAQVLRFWPAYEMLKEIYDSRRYGRLLFGNMDRIGSIPSHSWQDWMKDEEKSGLVAFDLHIHDLDYIVYAFGAPKAKTVKNVKSEGQNCLVATYEYEDFFVNCEASWYAASKFPFTATFRFVFEEAVVDFAKGRLMIYEKSGNILDSAASADGAAAGELQLPKTGAYSAELIYFADCAEKGVFPDKVKAEELYAVLDIIGH